MTKREDIPKRLIYTCNCGWVDKGHALPGGAKKLWQKFVDEDDQPVSYVDPDAFVLEYGQRMARWGVSVGKTRTYVVKKGLPIELKKSIALAIFQDISHQFEKQQTEWPYGWVTDSGFSVEDLVSNLIGFYHAVEGTDPLRLCKPVSAEASRRVWDRFGGTGEHKNKTFEPRFFDCDECKTKPELPKQLRAIKPAEIDPTPFTAPPPLDRHDVRHRYLVRYATPFDVVEDFDPAHVR